MPKPLAATRLAPLALGLLLAVLPGAAQAADGEQVLRLLEQRRCEGCRLQDADLVQADLRDARLSNAQLQRANLSGSRLDGADLRGADLSFTSLAGASLRGADLRGSLLLGTDLRQADLSGASLDPGALSRSHWQGAVGIASSVHSYAELHNAGVSAALAGQAPDAERWFSAAIERRDDAAHCSPIVRRQPALAQPRGERSRARYAQRNQVTAVAVRRTNETRRYGRCHR